MCSRIRRTPSGAVQVTANESATITSVSVAAALSIAAGGSAGVSVAGGGSSAVNQVAAMTTADISDVKIGSDTSAIGGGVTVAATDSSRITATEAVIAASVGIGGDAGVGVAIGISVAFNTITEDGTASGGQGKVSASVVDSSIWADGLLNVQALSSETIEASIITVAAGLSGGGAAGVQASAAGVGVVNTSDVATSAEIADDNNTSMTIVAGAVDVAANDTSVIDALGASVAVAVAFGGAAGVAVGIGLTVAENVIDDPVTATISGVESLTIAAAPDIDVTSPVSAGTVSVTATENAKIVVDAAAAAVSAGVGGSTGVAVAGGGVVALNEIDDQTTATVAGSTLGTAQNTTLGAVTVSATDNATIKSEIISAAASIAVGGDAGVGVAIGISVARNQIDGSAALTALKSGDIIADGSTLYRYTGSGESVDLSNDAAIVSDSEDFTNLGTTNDPDEAGDVATVVAGHGVVSSYTVTYKIASTEQPSSGVPAGQGQGKVSASVSGSSVTGSGAMGVTATSGEWIEADVAAIAVSVAGGTVGVAASVGGTFVTNEINVATSATIDGENSGAIKVGSLDVEATDQAAITANALAAGVSAAFGAVGVAFAIGVSAGVNTIDDSVTASISKEPSVTTTAGDVLVSATENATITANAAAASISISGGGFAVSVSGAGASAENDILGGVTADLFDSTIHSASDVDVEAFDTSTIDANIVAVSAAVAAGAAGGAAAIGVSVAENDIGSSSASIPVTAFSTDANVTASGTFNLEATNDASIDANVGSFVAAIASDVAASGAGASATNAIDMAVSAYVSSDLAPDSTASVVKAGSVNISALDTSKIDAEVDSAALSLAAGNIGASVSIGVSLAKNTISNSVEAYISYSAVTASSGSVDLSANKDKDSTLPRRPRPRRFRLEQAASALRWPAAARRRPTSSSATRKPTSTAARSPRRMAASAPTRRRPRRSTPPSRRSRPRPRQDWARAPSPSASPPPRTTSGPPLRQCK